MTKTTIITSRGKEKMALALATNNKINIHAMALGSSGRIPAGGETELETEVYRGLIAEQGIVDGQPNTSYFKMIVPENGEDENTNYGPWVAQEVGLYDDENELVAIGRLPVAQPKYDPEVALNSIAVTVRVIFDDLEAINLQYTPLHNLPWASPAEAENKKTKNRIIQVEDAHRLFGDPKLLDIYPDIKTANKRLSITSNANGTVTIDPGQMWAIRGVFGYSSDGYTEVERTLSHVANSTYHIRWTSGNGFEIKNLSDATYNPSGLAEKLPVFDSDMDDMIVALLTTDAANVATVRPLLNAISYHGSQYWAAYNGPSHTLTSAAYDFARSPSYALSELHPPGNSYDSDYQIYPTSVTRYQMTWWSWSWHHGTGGVQRPGFEFQYWMEI